jgi:hypothetical protein
MPFFKYCGFKKPQSMSIMSDHLSWSPFPEEYTTWLHHGKTLGKTSTILNIGQDAVVFEDSIQNMINDAFGVDNRFYSKYRNNLFYRIHRFSSKIGLWCTDYLLGVYPIVGTNCSHCFNFNIHILFISFSLWRVIRGLYDLEISIKPTRNVYVRLVYNMYLILYTFVFSGTWMRQVKRW